MSITSGVTGRSRPRLSRMAPSATWALGIAFLILAFGAAAQPTPENAGAAALKDAGLVRADLVADVAAVTPDQPFQLAVRLTIADDWHIYGPETGELGLPTTVNWRLPEGFSAEAIAWPATTSFEFFGERSDGYAGQVLLSARVTPPSALGPEPLKFSAAVSWLACGETCIPGDAAPTLELAVSDTTASPTATAPTRPAVQSPDPVPNPDKEARVFSFLTGERPGPQHSLGWYLFYAFLGGMLLNVMPCVLPVISLKIMGFVGQADQAPGRVFRLGLTYALGVLCSFAVLGALVIAMKAAGAQIGWGFQLQEPRFVIIVSGVVLALALSLFGVFEIELPGAASTKMDAAGRREGYGGAFFNGVLATALGTPCMAPMLGAAVGFAFTQNAPIIMAFFLTIGAGLAAPYVALTARPGWMRFLPRPGRWMERVEQLMGFVLMGFLVWLVSVLGSQAGSSAMTATLAFLLAVGLGAWLLGDALDPMAPKARRYTMLALALAIAVAGYALFPEQALRRIGDDGPAPQSNRPTHTSGDIAWEPFSVERVERLVAEGRPVFLDFSADWCLTCQVNERGALSNPRVVEALREGGFATVKADWTRRDETIGRILAQFGRSGVPLYVILPPGRAHEPIILPELLTVGAVLSNVESGMRNAE